jgi:HAD superfamily phosphatase (TIGR01668 family)
MITLHKPVELPKKAAFRFRPDFIAANVMDIDFAALRLLGITTCFVDLDDTVVMRAQYEVSPAIRTALKRSGMRVFVATNRPKSRDLKNLRKDLGAVGVIHPHGLMGKPTKRYFINALNDAKVPAHEAMMVGDRYLQDMLGANRAGIYSVLVHKLGKPAGRFDSFFSRLERRFTDRLSR